MSEVFKKIGMPLPPMQARFAECDAPLVPNNTLPPDVPWLPRKE